MFFIVVVDIDFMHDGNANDAEEVSRVIVWWPACCMVDYLIVWMRALRVPFL